MLNQISDKKYKNILLPSLGTGDYGFEHRQVGKIVKKVLDDYVSDKDINIDLVLYNKNDEQYYI
jgi:O-acetyl-ADP-ribose deacetylase (regulator of RNase III)